MKDNFETLKKFGNLKFLIQFCLLSKKNKIISYFKTVSSS